MKAGSGGFFERRLDDFDDIPIIETLNLVSWCGSLRSVADFLAGYTNRYWGREPAVLVRENGRVLDLMRVKAASLAVSGKGTEVFRIEFVGENDVFDEPVELRMRFEVGKAKVPAHEEEGGGIGKRGIILVR